MDEKRITVSLSQDELKSLLAEAARDGARKALSEVGLHDEDASQDVRELRNLIDSWRSAKATIGNTVLRLITTAVLVFIAGALAMKLGFHFGDTK